jgi:hypothetical protein
VAGEESDLVVVRVVPPSPLVSVDSMVTEDGRPGIRVGGRVYAVGGQSEMAAREPPGKPAALVQVLVLDRASLGFVSNRAFTDNDELEKALAGLDATKLVIAVLQKPALPGTEPLKGESLVQALAPIGFPKLIAKVPSAPFSAGSLSAIGVPQTNPGDADTHVDARGGAMTGYLTPDQWGNYGFVSPTLIPFSFPKQALDPSSPPTAGFEVTDYDPTTGKVAVERKFATHTPFVIDAGPAAEAMADFINQIPAGDPVGIRSFSSSGAGDHGNRIPPIQLGTVDPGQMTNLARAVAVAGGTRNAFNRIVFSEGPSDGTPVYALMGWAGAGEGGGQEVSLGVDNAGDRRPLPELSGLLRRDGQYRLRPVNVSFSGPVPDRLQQLVLRKPGSEAWPLENDPGAMRALAYLGDQDNRLGSDPRAAYWTHPGDESDWNNIALNIEGVRYPDKSDLGFTEREFHEAKAELLKELGWVGRVRNYMKVLSSPFNNGTAIKGWAETQTIADRIHLSAIPIDQGQSEIATRWTQLVSTILKGLGPLTDGFTTVLSAELDFTNWLAGANPDGTPGYDAVRVKADQLGATLVNQALAAQATYDRMGDIIVSDYHKLSVIGKNGGCDPAARGCDKEFSFTRQERASAVTGIARAVESLAYQKLVPLAYHVYQLNTDPRGIRDPGGPPDVGHYFCGVGLGIYNPFGDFPGLASRSLLQEIDPASLHNNRWDTFAMAVPGGFRAQHPPPQEILQRMFGPVSGSLDPMQGGLGISPTQLMTAAKHYSLYDTIPPDSGCNFTGGS